MTHVFRTCALAILPVTLAAGACRASQDASTDATVVARSVGSWEGTGDRMVGLVSESGAFRVRWRARNERTPGTGTFRLIVQSGVSGRSLEVLVDHRGEGSGTADFADDPRLYNLVVESANVDWAFSVEEFIPARDM